MPLETPAPRATSSVRVAAKPFSTNSASAASSSSCGRVALLRRRGGAASAELQYGDVVEALVVEGRRLPVSHLEDYRSIVDGLQPGSPVSVLVRRGRHASFVGLRADR